METTAKYRPNIQIVSDVEDLASRTVNLFVSCAREALELSLIHISEPTRPY